MADRCAADRHRGGVRCSKRGRYRATGVQPTTLVPAPAPEWVCFWHQGETVPARRPLAGHCECCGQKLP